MESPQNRGHLVGHTTPFLAGGRLDDAGLERLCRSTGG